ncbi:MAG: hypothetical protein SFW35_11360 [Chitinophagales bacterium]|nr:hypothetical protein [Chitinophagales bacterium]
MAIPITFIVLLMIYTSIRWEKDIDMTPEYGGYLINLWDIHPDKKQFNLADKGDSLALEMVSQHFFVNDPKHINPDYFKRIGVPYADKKLQSMGTLLGNKVILLEKIEHVALYYMNKHVGWLLMFLLILFVALRSWVGSSKFLFWSTLMVALAYLLLYFCISVFLKMEERIFCPLFLSFCLALTMLIKPTRFNASFLKPIVGIASICLIFQLWELGMKYRQRNSEIRYLTHVWSTLEKRPEKLQFVDYISDQMILKPLQSSLQSAQKQYPTIDNYCFFLAPSYSKMMKSLTGADELQGYLSFVADNPDECIMISNEQRISAILEYANYRYHTNFKAYPIIRDLRNGTELQQNSLEPLGIFKLRREE